MEEDANAKVETMHGDLVAMTFEEIAHALGIDKKAAMMRFYTGMKKLRARPKLLREFRELVEFRQKFRGW